MIATPPVALAVSPSRVVVASGQSREVLVTNNGAVAVAVDAAAFGFGVSLRGRPRILLRTQRVLLSPRRLMLPPGATRAVRVAPRGRFVEPGDHPAVVLFSGRAARAGVAVQLRVGVVVLLRAPGVVIHRLVVAGVHRARDALEVVFRNDGNVSERIGGRELLPHTRGIVVLRGRGVLVVRGGGRVWRFRLRR